MTATWLPELLLARQRGRVYPACNRHGPQYLGQVSQRVQASLGVQRQLVSQIFTSLASIRGSNANAVDDRVESCSVERVPVLLPTLLKDVHLYLMSGGNADLVNGASMGPMISKSALLEQTGNRDVDGAQCHPSDTTPSCSNNRGK